MKGFSKFLAVILGILIVVVGFYCLFAPGLTYLIVGWVVGFAMVLDAVAGIIAWWQGRKDGTSDGWMLTGAILSMVLGFFVLNSAALQLSLDVFIIYYIAVWLVIHGIITIVRSWKIRRLHKNWDTKMLGTHWYLPLILGILTILFGILCMFNPIIMASTIGIFIGLGIISSGANLITLAMTPAN